MTRAQPFSRRAQFSGPRPISELMHLALAHPKLISLAAGFVDQESLPVAEARQAVESVMADVDRARAALQYGTNAGYLPLRSAVLARFLAADGTAAAGRDAVGRAGDPHGGEQPDVTPGGRVTA